MIIEAERLENSQTGKISESDTIRTGIASTWKNVLMEYAPNGKATGAGHFRMVNILFISLLPKFSESKPTRDARISINSKVWTMIESVCALCLLSHTDILDRLYVSHCVHCQMPT